MTVRAVVVVLLLALGTACPDGPGRDVTLRFRVAGANRVARVHIPDTPDGRALPLVFNFHGYLSNSQQHQDYSRLNARADERGVIAVHPDGVNRSWNAGTCCGHAQRTGVDDVAFVDELLRRVEALHPVDRTRVYAMGLSNGGFMSYRLACERSDVFAALVPVAGVNVTKECTPARAVPLLHFHGTEDTIVPYEGSSSSDLVSAPESTRAWAEKMGCGDTRTETLVAGDVRCESFEGCPAGVEVTLCTVNGGGHTWPGADDFPPLGSTTHDVDATNMALDFMLRHTR